MAYLIQPDGSDTCCDCPTRTSPCDCGCPCAGVDPATCDDAGVSCLGYSTATLTFSLTDTRTAACNECSISVDFSASDYGCPRFCETFGDGQTFYHDIVAGTFTCESGEDLVTLFPCGSVSAGFGASLAEDADGSADCHGFITLSVAWTAIHGSFGGCNSQGFGACGSYPSSPAGGDLGTPMTENFPVDNIHKPMGTYTLNQSFSAADYSVSAMLVVTVHDNSTDVGGPCH